MTDCIISLEYGFFSGAFYAVCWWQSGECVSSSNSKLKGLKLNSEIQEGVSKTFKLLLVLFGPFIFIASMEESNGRYKTENMRYTYNIQPADLRETANRFTSLHWLTSCNCKDWIWNLCRRTMKWILMFIKILRRKPIVEITALIIGTVSIETKNIVSEKNVQTIQIDITTATTRLWVTSSLYLRWRWIAKNLSTLIATTLKSETFTSIRITPAIK